MFNNVTFAYPEVFWLLLVIPVMFAWYIKKNRKITPDVKYSSLSMLKGATRTWRERLAHLPYFLRLLALVLLIIAIARPQNFSSGENIYTEGIDIAILLDISSSMLAEDFHPNRLEAAKNVIDEFVEGRTSDKIGLVVFAHESFTQCPLTIDYNVLRNLLGDIKSGMIEDGTAIGTAIANGVNRLKDSDSKSKIIILLTDGVNNSGEIDPVSAAKIANTFGIRIYTVGVGTEGEAPYPVQTPFGRGFRPRKVEIDEDLLKEVSAITGGKYFRATDNQKLRQIYDQIDLLEKTRVEVTSYRMAEELYYSWAAAALFLLLIEFGLLRTYLRRLP